MITGALAMVKSLLAEEVSVVFGYPGATIAPFYDSLSRSGIRHILTRTEQGAGHCASGYARMSGRPGVCVTTSGPGATNLFTAVATAYSDSIPLVAITGQVTTAQLGRDVFQEVDTTGAVEPFTKYSYLVKSADDIGRIFKEAFYIASTGRKGPVLIDIPMDIQLDLVEFAYPKSVNIRGYKPRHEGHPLQVKRVAQALSQAKRPLICCGGGVFLADARQEVLAFCQQTSVPLVTSMMGIGTLPPNHPLHYGLIGQTGKKTANYALDHADLLILIGARVGDRTVLEPSALESQTTIVHIDIDSAEIGKNVGTTIPLVGDAKDVTRQLIEKNIKGDWADWLATLDEKRLEEEAFIANKLDKTKVVDPNVFVKTLCKKLPTGSVYLADVGQNQIWSARNFTADGRFLTTGGMGTMGYSIPAAIGAKLHSPEKMVVAVCGDGSFQMSMNELATICQQDVSLKIVIMRNGTLGMVKEIQDNAYNKNHFAIDLSGSPDFGLIAKAYGIEYNRIDKTQDCDGAIEQMLGAKGSYLLECIIDPEEASV